MIMVVDWRLLSGDLRREAQRAIAVRRTVNGAGMGEVITSARKKLPHERGKKVPHGAMIANILRNIGHDPFRYPEAVEGEVQEMIGQEFNEAVETAWQTERPNVGQVNRALLAGAQELAENVRLRLAGGQLGRSTGKYGKRKAILAKQGRLGVTSRYGIPPPVGVFTGRFLEGVRARLRARRSSA